MQTFSAVRKDLRGSSLKKPRNQSKNTDSPLGQYKGCRVGQICTLHGKENPDSCGYWIHGNSTENAVST